MLVLLFLPFSALDKILNFKGAVAQAREIAPNAALAKLLILAGLTVEIVMSAAILSGIADRAAAAILAAYCVTTALLWKRFWRPGDFWRDPNGKARGLFWDFWKNLALAGGFLLITFGTSASTVGEGLRAPLALTHPDEAQRGGPAGHLAADTLPDLRKHLDMAEHLSAE
jgi:putative oxidoreductase